MPSALLARIAARGQPVPAAESVTEPGPVAEPDPEPVVAPTAIAGPVEPEPVTRPEPTPTAVAAPGPVTEATRPAPWLRALAAPVAPWSSPTAPGSAGVVTPEPEPRVDGPGEPDLSSAVEIVHEPLPAGDTAAPAIEEVASDPVEAAEVPPVAAALTNGAGDQSRGDAATDAHSAPASAADVLESPYAPAAVIAAEAAAPARPITAPVAAAPEATEGELWALVGASEPVAASASTSEATRVILTILTAFLILVIVVGTLVLASQIP
jgi:hypothetical protein